jgi:hypothetical protein
MKALSCELHSENLGKEKDALVEAGKTSVIEVAYKPFIGRDWPLREADHFSTFFYPALLWPQ